MKQLIQSKLFLLLLEPSQNEKTINQFKGAYEEFALKLLNKLQIETNITRLYYHLGFVRLELVGIRETLSDGQEKNALKFTTKAISLIDIEQKLLQWQLQNNRGKGNQKEIISKKNPHWTGTAADLVEFAYGALETKKFDNGDIDINSLIEILCQLFSFEVKDCYDTFRAIVDV